MKILRIAATGACALLIVAVVACSLLSVWSVGGHQDEWLGTALVLIMVGIPAVAGCASLWVNL